MSDRPVIYRSRPSIVYLARETEEARRHLRASCRKWLEVHEASVTEALVDDIVSLVLSARSDAAEITRTEERHRAADYMRFDDGPAHSLAEDIVAGRHMAESCEHHKFNHHGCRDCERLFSGVVAQHKGTSRDDEHGT